MCINDERVGIIFRAHDTANEEKAARTAGGAKREFARGYI